MRLTGLAGFRDLTVVAHLGETILLRAQAADGSPVLVKTHASDLPTPDLRERFRREYEATTAAHHVHLVGVRELIDQPSRSALVLAEPSEVSLAEVIADGKLELGRLLATGVQVASALVAMHAAGLVHRAVDARHVAMSDAGAVLVDLYDACGVGARPRRDTHGAHPAPEQLASTPPPADPASDQYALGSMLEAALDATGEEPPTALLQVLSTLTDPDPRQRYRSMLGVLADLDTISRHWHDGLDLPEPFLQNRECPRLNWADPTSLVGRNETLAAIHTHIDTVEREGGCRVLVLRAEHGMGRSTLVSHLCDQLAERAVLSGLGRFLHGGQRLPLHAPLEMMDQVVGLLLTEPDDVVVRVGDELRRRVGDDLPLAAQVIPPIAHLVGEQPEPTSSPPEELVAVVERSVLATVGAIAQSHPPLVTVFDDGDHADLASLNTFELLAGGHDIGPLAVVVTAATRSPRLESVLERLAARGVPVDEVTLPPLSPQAIRRLVADGTGHDEEVVAPLASAVWTRSGGSPTLALADIWRLLNDGGLRVDVSSGGWVWNETALTTGGTTTVDSVAVERVARLGPLERSVLVAPAVAGRSLAVDTLSRLFAWSHEHTLQAIGKAEQSRVVTWIGTTELRVACLDNGVRAAILDSLGTDELRDVRERLVPALLASLPRDHDGAFDPHEEDRFTLIELLRGHRELTSDPGLGAQFVHLCSVAGRSAHRNAAFQDALDLQVAALDVADAVGSVHDDVVFDLLLRAAEHALALGHLDQVDDLLVRMDLARRPVLQRVKALRILGTRAWIRDDQEERLAPLRRILADLGQPVPERVTWVDLARELVATRRAIGTLPPEWFLTAPRIDDEDETVAAALEAMIGSIHLAYVDQPLTHIWLVLRGTRLTVQHGVSDGAAYFITAYGMLGVTNTATMNTGLRYGRVGRELAASSPRGVATMVSFAHDAFVRHWGEPLVDTIEPLLDGYRDAVLTRQRGYGLSGGTFAVLHGLLASLPLDRLGVQCTELRSTLEDLQERAFVTRVAVVGQAVADLVEGTGPLDGPHFSARRWFDSRSQGGGELALIVHTVAGLLAICRGDLTSLRQSTDAAARLLRTAPGQAVVARHAFHRAYLDAVDVATSAGPATRVRSRARAERSLHRLRRIAEHAPANASHQVALIEAILSEERPGSGSARAMDRYEQAVTLATANGALHDLGIAAERAATFHARRDRLALGRHYAALAQGAWEAWGATHLVETMAGRLPHELLLRSPGTPHAAAPRTEADATGLDPTSDTLAEASTLLGQELEVREFLARLMEVLMRHTEATRGYLVLGSQSGPVVEVAAHSAGDIVQVDRLASNLPQDHPELCVPAVHYVLRTRDVLSVIDPAADRRLRSDAALRTRSPRSLLGLPIGRSNATSGVLVLESDTYSHAFEPERIEALRVLSAQAISAIDQARLSSDLSILSDDVAELRATASELATKAETDALTGVANRSGMEARLHAAIRSAHSGVGRDAGTDPQVGVLFCDLDDFKAINDHFGHAAGDAALVEIARRLRSVTRADDIVARVGGDEFVVVSVGVSTGELERMAERALNEIARAIEVDGQELIGVSISIGVGRADLGTVSSIDDIDALVRVADQAMYQAKTGGKNRVHRDR